MTVWPSDLPQYFDQRGFGRTMPDNRVRSRNDVGPPKVRRRSSLNVYPLSGDMVMTRGQYADLEEFVRTTLVGGTLPFIFPHQLEQDPLLEIEFAASTPSVIMRGAPPEVRFASSLPTIQEVNGPILRVSLDLEVLPGRIENFDGAPTSFIDFERASMATFFDASRVMQTAANDVLRLDHDPLTGDALGALVEGQRTNLILWSEDFSNSSWTKTRSSVSGGKLVEDTSSSTSHFMGQIATVTSGETYTWWVDVEPDERTFVGVYAGGNIGAKFNLSTGAVSAEAGGGTGSIRQIDDTTYRCALTFEAAQSSYAFNIFLLGDNGATAFTGDGSSGLTPKRAQLELGDFPTSYIKAEGSQVTRAADSPTVELSAFPFNGQEGCFFVDAIATPNSVGALFSLAANGAGFTNYFRVLTTTGADGLELIFQGQNADGDVLGNRLIGSIATGDRIKVAISYDATGVRASMNGGDVTIGPVGWTALVVDTLQIGLGIQAGNEWDSHISEFSYEPFARSNARLKEMTA